MLFNKCRGGKKFEIKILINLTQKSNSRHRTLLFPKGMGKGRTKPQKGKTKEKSGYGGWLCKGNVLATLTSMVLHKNHLQICVYKKSWVVC